MAWSPQARAAAIASRKAHAHGPKIMMNGHHGAPGAKLQPVNPNIHKGNKVTNAFAAHQAAKVAKYGSKSGGINRAQQTARNKRTNRRVNVAATAIYAGAVLKTAHDLGATQDLKRGAKKQIARGAIASGKARGKVTKARSQHNVNKQFKSIAKHNSDFAKHASGMNKYYGR